jgi:hypothetical protein
MDHMNRVAGDDLTFFPDSIMEMVHIVWPRVHVVIREWVKNAPRVNCVIAYPCHLIVRSNHLLYVVCFSGLESQVPALIENILDLYSQ